MRDELVWTLDGIGKDCLELRKFWYEDLCDYGLSLKEKSCDGGVDKVVFDSSVLLNFFDFVEVVEKSPFRKLEKNGGG